MTVDVIENVYNALTTDAAITGSLHERAKGIVADLTHYSGRYPAITYQVISDVPALWGDDAEIFRRITIQINVITKDGADTNIVFRIETIMNNLGWRRESNTRLVDGTVRITAMRFVIEERNLVNG